MKRGSKRPTALKSSLALQAGADCLAVSVLNWDRLNFLAPAPSSFTVRTAATLEETSGKAGRISASMGHEEVELWLPLLPVNEGS